MDDDVWKTGEYPSKSTPSELPGARGKEIAKTFGRDSGADAIKAEQELVRRFPDPRARETARTYLQIEQEELEANQQECDQANARLFKGVSFDRLQDLEFNRWFNQQLIKNAETCIRSNDQTQKGAAAALDETERLQHSTEIGPKDPLGPDRMLVYRPKERTETGRQWDAAVSEEELQTMQQRQAEVEQLWADLAKTTPNVRAFDDAAAGRTDQAKSVGDDGGRTI